MSSSLASVELAWLREENARLREENGRLREQLRRQKNPHALSPVHVSPAMRLYRHALESIFAMLELEDLIYILAVSRSWAAAMRSMKPINASIQRDECRSTPGKPVFRPLPPIAEIVASPLLRHITAIHFRSIDLSLTPVANASLRLLAQHASNLTSLWCTLSFTSADPLIWPAKLQSLHLRMGSGYTDVAIHSVLMELATLPLLSRLELRLPTFDDLTPDQFRIFAACPSLTDLTLRNSHGGNPTLSDAQVDQIRESLGHLQRFNVGSMGLADLARYLQPPVTVQWRDIAQVYVYDDAGTGELLLRLPSLTRLDLHYDRRITHADFLPQLSLLTALNLDCVAVLTPGDILLASLVRCTHITELSLRCELNSAHWSTLFARLILKKLTVWQEEMETLECFASGTITQSLEELTLRDLVQLPHSELSQLYALRRLRTLDLHRCFQPRLDDSTIASLFPPTPLLPALTQLADAWLTEDGRWEHRESQGPSFEWMQQRRTQ